LSILEKLDRRSTNARSLSPPSQRNRVAAMIRLILLGGLQQDELIPAKSGHMIDIGHDLMKSLGDRPQQGIAGGVAKRVVDRLELVEIEHQNREVLAQLPRARHQQRIPGHREQVERAGCDRMKDVVAFEIASRRDIEGARQRRALLGTEDRIQLRRCPQVEATLVALRVGVEAGVEATFWRRHFALHEGKRLLNHPRKRRLLGQLPAIEIGARQQGVVIKHLLEVGNEPALVDTVAVKTATQLVVDATGGHRAQRVGRHLERGRLAGPDMIAQQKLEQHRLRKFGCAAEAAVGGIIIAGQSRVRLVEQARV